MKKVQHLFACGICAVMLAFVACKQSVTPGPTTTETLTGITAVYSSTNPIFTGMTLHTLRDGLTVTANYNDGTTRTLTLEEYELSGTLAEGSSVITVTYQGKTTTFTVTVSAAHTHIWGNWTQLKPPTCTTPGEKQRECTATTPPHPETDVGDPINPNAHTWGNSVPTTPATFVTAGTGTRTCTLNHSHTENQTLPVNPVMNIEDWNDALTEIRTRGSGDYTITIGASFGGIMPLGATPTATTGFGTATSLTVTLKGSGTLDTANSNGSMFRLRSEQTLVIDSPDLTLRGRRQNQHSHTGNNILAIIYVESGGTLDLKNGKISGNTCAGTAGSGVLVSGTFTMSGGEISDNIIVSTGANVTGGGVYINGGAFTMSGGTISGNRASSNGDAFGGGVYLSGNNGTFTMSGGTISGNSATSNNYNGRGGGVYASGTFTMNGGEISGNSVSGGTSNQGGGVYVYSGYFRIVTGTVYGSDANPTTLQNTATSGAALYRSNGTAQYGTFSGTNWVGTNLISSGNVFDNTINVENGMLQ